MSCRPKFLYAFCNTPVPIPNSFLAKLDNQIVSNFIWAQKLPYSCLCHWGFGIALFPSVLLGGGFGDGTLVV